MKRDSLFGTCVGMDVISNVKADLTLCGVIPKPAQSKRCPDTPRSPTYLQRRFAAIYPCLKSLKRNKLHTSFKVVRNKLGRSRRCI